MRPKKAGRRVRKIGKETANIPLAREQIGGIVRSTSLTAHSEGRGDVIKARARGAVASGLFADYLFDAGKTARKSYADFLIERYEKSVGEKLGLVKRAILKRKIKKEDLQRIIAEFERIFRSKERIPPFELTQQLNDLIDNEVTRIDRIVKQLEREARK